MTNESKDLSIKFAKLTDSNQKIIDRLNRLEGKVGMPTPVKKGQLNEMITGHNVKKKKAEADKGNKQFIIEQQRIKALEKARAAKAKIDILKAQKAGS